MGSSGKSEKKKNKTKQVLGSLQFSDVSDLL